VLIVGGGGREHALVSKLASEPNVAEVVCTPGNAGIARLARCVAVDPADPLALVAVAEREDIDLTIVGPELPLSRGVADVFAAENRLLFGPTVRAARLESSKVFAKDFMRRHGIPAARSESFTDASEPSSKSAESISSSCGRTALHSVGGRLRWKIYSLLCVRPRRWLSSFCSIVR